MKLTRAIEIEVSERAGGGKTFSATVSTETPVPRPDYERGGTYNEVLSHARGAVNLARAPLPLLASHDRSALPVGVVDNLRVADGKLRGEIRFGASQRAQEIAADVEAGVIRNLSVGYTIDAKAESTSGKVRTVTATKWTPHEVSAVSVGADPAAGIGRSQTMEHEDTGTDNPQERTVTMTQIAIRHGCSDEFLRRHLAAGTDLDAYRQAVLEDLARRNETALRADVAAGAALVPLSMRTENDGGPSYTFSEMRSHLGELNRRVASGRVQSIGHSDDFRAAACDAIILRAGLALKDPHPAARDVSASVRDLASTCISRAGVTVQSRDDAALIERAMTTSDFPYILADAMHKSIRMGYEEEPSSHRQWVRTTPVVDFRDQHRPILGSAPALEEVLEAAEYKEGSLSDDSTSYRVAKYGKVVSLSWEALRNDDLSAFIRIQPSMGQAARRKEADVVYDLFALNAGAGPAMQDGTNLFDAAHGNVTAAGAVDDTTLGLARALLRKQTALGGGYLSLVPKYIIVDPDQETALDKLLTLVTRRVLTVDAAQPEWIGNLEKVVEPRLDGSAFYLAASAGQIDHCELGLLEEQGGTPYVEAQQEFKADVYKWKVRHTFGAKFLDWRGIVKVPLA